MVNRKRTQAKKLKQTRNRRRVSNLLLTSLIIGGTLIPVTVALADSLDTDTETPVIETIASTEQSATQETSLTDEQSATGETQEESQNNESSSTTETGNEVQETVTSDVPNETTTQDEESNGGNTTEATDTEVAEDSPGVDVWICSPGEGIGSALTKPIHLEGKVGETWSYDYPDTFTDENGKIWYNTYHVGNGVTHYSGTFTNELTYIVNWYSDTPTLVVDEENRSTLEQTIQDAKPYLNKDKYQAKYVDALDQAIKAGEQALTDNPQVQSRSLLRSNSTKTVFEPHIDAINTALADVKAHPVKDESPNTDSTDNSGDNSNNGNNPNTDNGNNTSISDTKNNATNNVATSRDTNKGDSLPQTGEADNPWLTVTGLTTLASVALLWFFKRKKAQL